MLDLDISQIIIQIIAFLVMFWVLKRYGWGPLLKMLDARQKKNPTRI
jgi:F-type H+-transporting ATPase subunit b